MRKITKNKVLLTVAQVSTLACAVGVVKSKSKAGKTMFGIGAVGTTIWSILRGVNIDNEDDVYYRENVEGVDNDNVEGEIDRLKSKRAGFTDKAWSELEKVLDLVGLKKSDNSDNVELKTVDELLADIPVAEHNAVDYIEPFDTEYMRVTAPFVYNDTSNDNAVMSNKRNNKVVGEVSIEAMAADKSEPLTKDIEKNDVISNKGIDEEVEEPAEFGLLDEIETQPIKWAELEVVGDKSNIWAVDEEIFNILRSEYNYSFIREQAPSSESWLYYVPEEKGTPERERFIAVSVDLNKMMDAYRNGEIKGTKGVKYDIQHIYKYDTEMRKPVKITSLSEMTADTVYISERGTVLVLLGRSNTRTIHTAASKHCKRVSLVTLEELNKATCSCLWS